MLISTLVLLVGLASGAPDDPPVAVSSTAVSGAGAVTPAAQSTSQDDKQAQQPPQPAPAGSDAPAEAKKPPTPPHTGLKALAIGLVEDAKHLPAKENGYLLLLGGGLALAAHQVDSTFNQHLASHYTFVNGAFAPAKYYGDTPMQAALSVGTYAYGRMFDQPKVSHLGMDLLRAQLLTEGLVQALKFSTGRERPDGSNNHSFPSGHAAVTFAGATVLERHLGWKNSALAYAIATYVAASRLHDNVHYLSDVAFGAAVGTIAGRTITQHGRENWTLVPAALPGGAAIYFTRTGN